MEEQFNFRANFSNTTTPSSSGGRQLNEYGEEIASIPLQLPTNLIPVTRRPKRVEVQLSKLNVPLTNVPVAQLPVREVLFTSYTHANIRSTGLVTIWPFHHSGGGTLSGRGYQMPFYRAPAGGPPPSYIWPVGRVNIPIRGTLENTKTRAFVKHVEERKMYDFYTFEELCGCITHSFETCLKQILSAVGGDDFPVADVFTPYFTIGSNGEMKVTMYNRGSKYALAPFHPEIYDRNGSLRDSLYPFCKRIDRAGACQETYNGDRYSGAFSLVVNHVIRDLFPSLPWIEYDNDELVKWADHPALCDEIPGWTDRNDGDSKFYALDTTAASLSVDQYANECTFKGDASSSQRILTSNVNFSFMNVSFLSVIPVMCFCVTLDGIGMSKQSFPVNISQPTASSALTAQLPILEVYYPFWQDLKDLSTNLIVVKDAFSNTAPIVLDEAAIHERNIRVTVHYVTKDGWIHKLTIPPSSYFSFQMCFSIFY